MNGKENEALVALSSWCFMLDLPAEHPGEPPGEPVEPSATAAAAGGQPTLVLKEGAVRSEVR